MERESVEGFPLGVPWIAFTADDIKARISAREMQVYEETANLEYPDDGGDAELPESPLERMPIIASQLLARFRDAIRANPNVIHIGPNGTLPDFCISEAAVIGRVAAIGLNPVPEGMTDPRSDEYNAAKDFLKSLPGMNSSAFAETDAQPSESPSSIPSYGGSKLLDF